MTSIASGNSIRGRRLATALCALCAGVLLLGDGGRAQSRPIFRMGVIGLVQQLHRLRTTASVLHTGAHPDDEDTALIARLALGDHARVAYLSLNRGEGGQNIIGPELFDALGVIRSEELLQARTLDGGQQLFTRAYDFGFTKTRQEAADRWGEQEILGDMVRAIRVFRPLVIISRFSGTSQDGHGHHQLAGYLTPIAFHAAADPTRFPEQLAEGLRPWQARKLYVGEGFRPDPEQPPTLDLATGLYDPLFARSYAEVAMMGRSQHKSQQMGVLEVRGPRTSGLRLVEDLTAGGREEEGVFHGIDTSVPGLARLVGLPAAVLGAELEAIDEAARRALDELDVERPVSVIPALADGLRATRRARAMLADHVVLNGDDAASDAGDLLQAKEQEFEAALVRAAGVVVDGLADSETVVPAETFSVTTKVYAPRPSVTTLDAPRLVVPSGWHVEPGELASSDSGGPFGRFFVERPDREASFRVRAPATARPTQPYWLEVPRSGDVFTWPDAGPRGVPFAAPLLTAEVPLRIGGVSVTVRRPVEYRYADRVRGELRRPLEIVPAITVALGSDLEVIPMASGGLSRRLSVRLESHQNGRLNGTVELELPAGWVAEPATAAFSLEKEGERTAIDFDVRPPATLEPSTQHIKAVARVADERFDLSMQTIAYPHIQTHRLYEPAQALVQVVDLEVSPVRVGYIMGSGDLVPEAIRRMGLEVTLLDVEQLRSGDLSAFDTIVVGVRASQTRPDFVANHGRLMAWVRSGGTLVVQYQQTDYVARDLPPYPAEMRSRITDETAPVTILEPEHAAFTFPNRITDEDWEGWVQERSLYSFRTFDPRYVPLLESRDPGEPPQRGGEVYAELERGRYVYTAFAWFRQLPAGVPGAYRLFANLLSLGHAPAVGR